MGKIQNVVIGLLCLLGCSNRIQSKYYFCDSHEYNKIVAQFKYSLSDAVKLIGESEVGRMHNGDIFLQHIFVCDEYYVFPDYINWKVATQNLSGYWVNANTGEVKNVQTKENYNLMKIANRKLKDKWWDEGHKYTIHYKGKNYFIEYKNTSRSY